MARVFGGAFLDGVAFFVSGRFFAGVRLMVAGIDPALRTPRASGPADEGFGVGDGDITTGGPGMGAGAGPAGGVATEPADTAVVFTGCCVPFVLPNNPAMNGLPMHS